MKKLVTTVDTQGAITATDGLPLFGKDKTNEHRLGVMGGTFDPIHNGHLLCAQQALDEIQLDAVVFMVSGTPAFKQGSTLASAEDRYAMMRLATADNSAFFPSRLEVDRPGPTYTVDTLQILRDFYPDNVKLYFIIGVDAIINILSWREVTRVAQLATFVVAMRPGYDFVRVQQILDSSPVPFSVRVLGFPGLMISSSYLRECLRLNKSIRYLTPESVCSYIHKHRLYGGYDEVEQT